MTPPTLLSTPRRPADAHTEPGECSEGTGRPYRVSSQQEEPQAATVRCLGLLCHVCLRYDLVCERYTDRRP